MANQPLISVLIPTYNCEDYIKDAVQSILNQSYSNFECIIIDDCSTDQTVSKIKAFNDNRIKLIVKPKNSGYTKSLNYGLTIAKGKYIARMDGDDISLPNRFEKQIEVLEKNHDIVVCGSIFKILDSDVVISAPEEHDDIKLALLRESCIGHPTAIIRKSTLDKNNINYNTEYEPAEDYDLWVRLSQLGKLYNIQEVLFLYRVHDNQVSTTKKEIQRKSASKSRFNMLCSLNFEYTEKEKEAYIKQFSYTERLKFKELLLLIGIKKKAIASNVKASFKKKDLISVLLDFEEESLRQYFIGSKRYNPLMVFQYLHIILISNYRLSNKKFFKLFIKSIFFHKAKSNG
ncbi:glycosyltransferase family 2 protein [Lacinutrix chionoecetis]